MKRVILSALMAASFQAQAADISVEAGRCAAYYFVRNDMTNARIAMNHSQNRGQTQVAANAWVELAQRDPGAAVKQAQMACIYHLRMKM